MRDEEQLKKALRRCDIVICHLFGNLNDIHKLLRGIFLYNFILECRTKPNESSFIAISSVLTWNRNKYDEENPLLEENFRSRDPHPKFIPVKTIETQILAANTELLSCYVLGCGVFYGRGENYFNEMFKEAWLCSPDGVGIPCYNGKTGANKLPTIHISDMAKLVQACHSEKPENHYILAVDKGKNTVHDICEAISKKLGIGRLREWSDEEAKENMLKYDGIAVSLQMNLEFDTENYTPANVTIEWTAEVLIIFNLYRMVLLNILVLYVNNLF